MQERAFGGEAGTERDHDTPVALARLSVLEHLVQHEQYSGRRQIAESTQYLARVNHLVVRELQVSLRPLEHPPTCRVQDPELYVFPSETVVLEDAYSSGSCTRQVGGCSSGRRETWSSRTTRWSTRARYCVDSAICRRPLYCSC